MDRPWHWLAAACRHARERGRRDAVLRVCTFSRYERVGRFFERNGFMAVASGDGAGNEEHEPDIRYERSTRT